MVSVSHNGGHDDRWNMKMYVIFVLLLKVNNLSRAGVPLAEPLDNIPLKRQCAKFNNIF